MSETSFFILALIDLHGTALPPLFASDCEDKMSIRLFFTLRGSLPEYAVAIVYERKVVRCFCSKASSKPA